MNNDEEILKITNNQIAEASKIVEQLFEGDDTFAIPTVDTVLHTICTNGLAQAMHKTRCEVDGVLFDSKGIDSLITHWRKNRDNAPSDVDYEIAVHYIDAYQTVRLNHGLERLK